MTKQDQNLLDLVLVHSDSYGLWRFSDNSATQGRRFTRARDGIVADQAALFATGGAVEVPPRPASREELSLVHSGGYLAEVLDQFECREWDGPRPDLADLAALLAGGTLVALELLLAGRTQLAVNLAGAKHHAQYDRSSGFCVFADFALAAKLAASQGLRVAILDFDAHHGDGTENLCAELPLVLTYSVHQHGIFPWTGTESNPEMAIYNKPVICRGDERAGDHDPVLWDAVGEFIQLAGEFSADLVMVAAGADGHTADPLSDLTYTPSGVNAAMVQLRKSLPNTPILLGGAGGYRPDDETPAMWRAAVSGLLAGQCQSSRLLSN